jgi:2-hydroxy-3-oxopropionate reductase
MCGEGVARMTDGAYPLVGFIGLGIMGKPMARNLLRSRYELIVNDIRHEPVDELADEGAAVGANPYEVARASDLLITMLPDSSEVQAVYLGPNGAAGAARPGWLAVDMSSISPSVARSVASKVEAAGAQMIDAPVSGGDKGAIAGTLSIMVGGSCEAFNRALPVLQKLGTTIVHVGPAGAGQIAKVCNQVVVGVVIEGVSEALVLAAKAGVAPARVLEVLQGGLAATKVLDLRGSNMLEGRYEPGFRLRLHLKDLRNALQLGQETGVVLPAATQVAQLMNQMVEAGRGDLDHSGLISVLEDMAGVRVCSVAGGG